jgi:NAD(P)-dependent dehydrogenase (short-subunit alcohol dehydrogenase family)
MNVQDIGTVGRVLRPSLHGVATPFTELDDATFEAAWEAPMRELIVALQDAYRQGRRRIVVVVSTLGMSGGAGCAHLAATAEAARVLVKSAARQWGPDGVTVNAVALGPEASIDDPSLAGPTSIAPPA